MGDLKNINIDELNLCVQNTWYYDELKIGKDDVILAIKKWFHLRAAPQGSYYAWVRSLERESYKTLIRLMWPEYSESQINEWRLSAADQEQSNNESTFSNDRSSYITEKMFRCIEYGRGANFGKHYGRVFLVDAAVLSECIAKTHYTSSKYEMTNLLDELNAWFELPKNQSFESIKKEYIYIKESNMANYRLIRLQLRSQLQ